MRGFLASALTLLVLHALVARANQAQLTGLVGALTGASNRFLDPTVPAIADRRGGTPAHQSAAAEKADTTGKAVLNSALYPTPKP
jgi:hypothetical protein